MVVLVPDSGRGYLSRVYSDEWMADHGFLRTTGHTVSEVLERKSGMLRGLIHVHPSEQARQAIAVMQEFGVSQLAVIQAEPPLAAAEVVGAVYERDLMQRAVADPGLLDRTGRAGHGTAASDRRQRASRWTSRCSASRMRRRCSCSTAAIPVGVLTRSDALAFLAQSGVARDLSR